MALVNVFFGKVNELGFEEEEEVHQIFSIIFALIVAIWSSKNARELIPHSFQL
jgi:hypothetical protein